MKIIVCGGRDFKDRELLFSKLDEVHGDEKNITLLAHGAAKGADTLADEWATLNNVLVRRFYANWYIFGTSAGVFRNATMLHQVNPDLVVVFPGGKGTRHMKNIAEAKGCTVWSVAS